MTTPEELRIEDAAALRAEIEILIDEFEAKAGVRVTRIGVEHGESGVTADVYLDLSGHAKIRGGVS